jgi:glycerol-3-phosphate dehydrogenase (NAD(P)+)
MSLEEALKEVGMVVEGVKACRAFYQLKEKIGISMPITDGLYKGLFEGKNPKSIFDELINRDKKSETF